MDKRDSSPAALGPVALAHAVFAHAAIGICISDHEHRIIDANPRFGLIVGDAPEDLGGRSLLARIAPEDQDLFVRRQRDLRDGPVAEVAVEVRLIRADGGSTWIRSLGSLLPRADGPPLYLNVCEDITAERQVAAAGRESERRFEKLADSMPQIVWTADAAGRLDYCNRIWLEYSGTTMADNADLGWSASVHPEDLPDTVARWSHSVATGQSYGTEFRLRAAGGEYRWHVTRATAVRHPDGTIDQWYGTSTDIHEAKLLVHQLEDARADLEGEQQKFRTIFADSSTSMAVLRGTDLTFEIMNTSYADLFPGRALIGRPFTEALPELIGQAFPDLARRVFETGEAYVDREARAVLRRRIDGPLEQCFFDQSYTRMDDQRGRPYGVFIHAREVTDLVLARREIEESAERFRLAVDTADMGTWDLDPRTTAVQWSPRAADLFGAGPLTTTTDYASAVASVHPDDRERVERVFAAALDPASNDDYSAEFRTRSAGGDERWVSVLGKAFFTGTGSDRVATRVTGVVLDITDRMMAEGALREAKDRAETASAAKSAFLANMSHEIRTPLGAIMGFVGLMRDDNLDRSARLEYVSIIERNSAQLMRIIDDILDLSKVEAGMMLIEHIDFSLIELISDFASLMGFRARERGIGFEVRAQTKLPELIRADPTRLRQILTNVVGNAIKFTEVGGVKLRVGFADGVLTFEVHDTGRGIGDDQRANLFQPFAQADASTTRKFGGTGLGLVLTRRLTEAMGGTFELGRSRPGDGSVFTATVRVQVPPDTVMVRALGFANEVARDAAAPAQLRDLRVLLVEDSPDNQALFSIYLNRAGAHLDIAGDGARGVEMALGAEYDVVLMDVQMPIMDGITAVKTLRERGYRVPIVALTAHAMKEERTRCLNAGYTQFLSKPIARADLIGTLVRYLPAAT